MEDEMNDTPNNLFTCKDMPPPGTHHTVIAETVPKEIGAVTIHRAGCYVAGIYIPSLDERQAQREAARPGELAWAETRKAELAAEVWRRKREAERDHAREIAEEGLSPRERADGELGVDLMRREHWPSREAHLRFLIDGGYDLEEGGETEWIPGAFTDPNVQVAQAVRGATQRDYEVVWEYRGASEYLTADHFDLGYGAVAFANCMGLVLNTWTTIVWASVGITGDFAVAQADRQFRELLRKRLVKRGLPVVWLWVLERSAKRGLHAHMLAHVPQADVDWVKQATEECIATVAERPVVKVPGEKTVMVKSRHDKAFGPQWFWFRYMMKGIEPTTALNDPARPGHFVPLKEIAAMRRMDTQGLVRTQRFGVSRALHQLSQARQRALTGLPENALRAGAMNFYELFDNRYYEWSQRDENRRRTDELLKTLMI